jgi:hypothetical protein
VNLRVCHYSLLIAGVPLRKPMHATWGQPERTVQVRCGR